MRKSISELSEEEYILSRTSTMNETTPGRLSGSTTADELVARLEIFFTASGKLSRNLMMIGNESEAITVDI
jgi:hypothetical protein